MSINDEALTMQESDDLWEKSEVSDETILSARSYAGARSRYLYLFLGLALLAVVAYLVITGTATGRFYVTVEELKSDPDKIDKDVRVAGAVVGSSINFDTETQTLTFTVAHIPNDNDTIREQGGLGNVLHNASQAASKNPPQIEVLNVVWKNAESIPDLLQDEAQAIMNGRLGEDGKFYATEVLLKCPTKYNDEVPEQTGG